MVPRSSLHGGSDIAATMTASYIVIRAVGQETSQADSTSERQVTVSKQQA